MSANGEKADSNQSGWKLLFLTQNGHSTSLSERLNSMLTLCAAIPAESRL